MSNDTKLLLYRCYPTDACEDCKKYNNLFFHEDNAPKLPIHENCRCYYEPLNNKHSFNLFSFLANIVKPKNGSSIKSTISSTPQPSTSSAQGAPEIGIQEPEIPSSLSYITKINDMYSIIHESNNLTHVSDQMVELLKKYETPYSKYLIKDSNGNILGIKPHDVGDGGITVGYGHFISEATMRNDPEAYSLTQRNLSVREATDLMKRDLEHFEKQILNLMRKNDIYLVQHEFDALVLQAYNYGNVNYLTDLLKSGSRDRKKWIEVITERMEVNRGKFYNGLMNRRYQEMDLFLYADYNGGPDVKKYP